MNRLSTRTMGRRILGLVLALFSAALCLQHLQAPAAAAGKPNLATITGAVLDNKGNPVSGALISLLRDGANKIIKRNAGFRVFWKHILRAIPSGQIIPG